MPAGLGFYVKSGFLNAVPDSLGRFMSNTLRMGSFIVSAARKE
jgi:hypothetical protein